jgi:hypothetical protein
MEQRLWEVVPQLFKKSPSVYGNWSFTTLFKRVCNCPSPFAAFRNEVLLNILVVIPSPNPEPSGPPLQLSTTTYSVHSRLPTVQPNSLKPIHSTNNQSCKLSRTRPAFDFGLWLSGRFRSFLYKMQSYGNCICFRYLARLRAGNFRGIL